MISTDRLISHLQEDLTRKSHSFAEYMAASSPYVAQGKEEMWELLLKVRAEEQEHARRISRLLISLGGVPNPGLFDASAADMNYLSIDYLYGLLIRSKCEYVKTLDRRLEETRGFHEAFLLLGDMLDAEQRHITQLEECLARHRTKPCEEPVTPPSETTHTGPRAETKPEAATTEPAKPKFDLQAYLAAHKAKPKTPEGGDNQEPRQE